jgi:copper homeostasis protein
MRHRNASLGMGRTDLEREYRRTVTDADLVARTIEAARGG